MHIIGLLILFPLIFIINIIVVTFLVAYLRNGRKLRPIDYKGICVVAGIITLGVYGIIFMNL